MKKIFIAENHHEVLPFWAACRRNSAEAPAVLTLDHHTDVVRAFRDESCSVPEGAWQEEGIVAEAVSRLRHDEHFDWAVRSGMIREAWISSHTCATPPADERLHVCCDDRWPEENELFRSPEKFRPLADSVLESDYLFSRFGEIGQYGAFILDIDCDYFLTAQAFSPRDPAYFRELAEQAQIITFSLEKDWVRLLKLPGENISAQDIAGHLSRLAEY